MTAETLMGSNLSPWEKLFGGESISKEGDEKRNHANQRPALVAAAAEVGLKVGLTLQVRRSRHPQQQNGGTNLDIEISRVHLLVDEDAP